MIIGMIIEMIRKMRYAFLTKNSEKIMKIIRHIKYASRNPMSIGNKYSNMNVNGYSPSFSYFIYSYLQTYFELSRLYTVFYKSSCWFFFDAGKRSTSYLLSPIPIPIRYTHTLIKMKSVVLVPVGAAMPS